MKSYLLLLSLAALLIIIGCASNSTTTLLDQAAYLKFIGNDTNVSLKIDEGEEFLFNPEHKQDLIYQYPAGVHIISIFRDGELIYKKNVLLENGKITEVLIP